MAATKHKNKRDKIEPSQSSTGVAATANLNSKIYVDGLKTNDLVDVKIFRKGKFLRKSVSSESRKCFSCF